MCVGPNASGVAQTYAMLMHMQGDLPLGEAANAIGVRADVLRRWDVG